MLTKPQTKQEAINRINAIEKELPQLRAFIESTEPKDIMECVKSFDDALKIYINKFGALPNVKKDLLEYSGHDKDMIAAQGFLQMSIVRAVLNEGWSADWTDSNQVKYYPWFDMSSGSGLSYYVYGDGCSSSFVGSRLCFKSRDLAKYAGTQFKSIYEKFYII
jgi:hypothetical protein